MRQKAEEESKAAAMETAAVSKPDEADANGEAGAHEAAGAVTTATAAADAEEAAAATAAEEEANLRKQKAAAAAAGSVANGVCHDRSFQSYALHVARSMLPSNRLL